MVLHVCLAIAITLQCGNTAFAMAPLPRQEYSNNGVLYTYNADGTFTATIYIFPAVKENQPVTKTTAWKTMKTAMSTPLRMKRLRWKRPIPTELFWFPFPMRIRQSLSILKLRQEKSPSSLLTRLKRKQMKFSTVSQVRGFQPKMVDQVARLEAKRGDCAPTEAAGTDQQEDPLSNLL